jgi:hypothetical protein
MFPLETRSMIASARPGAHAIARPIVDELQRSARRAQLVREQKHRGDPEPRHAGALGGRLLRHSRLEGAAAEAEAQQLGHRRAALADEIRARDAAVDDAVLHVLRDVGSANEQDLDGSVAARERESALAGLLRTEAGLLEQMDRRLAQAALRRDGDLQALAEPACRRSSACR